MNLLKDKTILIVGLGLIGGSIARGLTVNKTCHRILAVGRDEASLQAAMLDGNIHAYDTDLATLAPEADLIMITVPTLAVREILRQLKDLVADEVIISDAASVKANVVSDARQILGAGIRRFVPGHPIAGSERSGYAASRADLFNKRKTILTPLPENDTLAVRTVMALWQSIGAEIHAMSAGRHDQVLAGTSHLPHLLAYTLVNTLVDSISEPDRVQQVFDYAAGGFADFSRIASSDPVMWRDVFLANSQATVDVLDAYIVSLQRIRSVLLRADADALMRDFSRAKQVRDEFYQRFQSAGTQRSESGSRQSTLSGSQAGMLTGRPGLSVQGEFRAPASISTARQYLNATCDREGVSVLHGVPEDAATLALVQQLRNMGVPVVGPEQGVLTVFGTGTDTDFDVGLTGKDETEHGRSPAVTPLPANDFVVLAMALAASVVPQSCLLLSGVYAGANGKEHPLLALQEMGANFEFSGEALLDIVVRTSTLHGCELDFRNTSLNADEDAVDAADEQILAYIVAGLFAGDETRLRVDNLHSNSRVMNACQAWQGLGARIQVVDDGIVVYRSALIRGALACSEDPEFTLLSIVLAQRAEGHIDLSGTGAFAEKYPGLTDRLQALGFGLSVEALTWAGQAPAVRS